MVKEPKNCSLETQERITVVSFLLIFGFVLLVASRSSPESLVPPNQTISVKVRGAVEKPGVLELPPGSLLEDIYPLVQPLNHARVLRLRKNSKLWHGEQIEFIRPTIEVEFIGAVPFPQKLEVARGVQIADILEQLTVNDDADIRKISLKKLVKEGQKIKVPKKRSVVAGK